MATGTCENCGDTEDELVEVNRVYLPVGGIQPGGPGPEIMEEVELWCYACCTQFPHQRLD